MPTVNTLLMILRFHAGFNRFKAKLASLGPLMSVDGSFEYPSFKGNVNLIGDITIGKIYSNDLCVGIL